MRRGWSTILVLPLLLTLLSNYRQCPDTAPYEAIAATAERFYTPHLRNLNVKQDILQRTRPLSAIDSLLSRRLGDAMTLVRTPFARNLLENMLNPC